MRVLHCSWLAGRSMDTDLQAKGAVVRRSASGSWRIAQRPSTLSTASTGLKPSHTFPSPGYYSGYYSRLSVGGTCTSYSRHNSQPAAAPRRLRHSLQLDSPSSLTSHRQELERRFSHELAASTSGLHRAPPTHWPVRPIRSSVHSEASSTVPSSQWRDSIATLWPLPSSAVRQYRELLQDTERGIPTQERLVAGHTQQVFTGADALEWFVENMVGVTSLEKSQKAGTQLVEAGLIVNVSGQGNDAFFGSPHSLYQFRAVEEEDRPQAVGGRTPGAVVGGHTPGAVVGGHTPVTKSQRRSSRTCAVQ